MPELKNHALWIGSLLCLVLSSCTPRGAQSETLFSRGVNFYNAEKYAPAIASFRQLLAQEKDPHVRLSALTWLQRATLSASEYKQCIEVSDEALSTSAKVYGKGDNLESVFAINKTLALLGLGEIDQAEQALKAAESTSQQCARRAPATDVLFDLIEARVAETRGEWLKAADIYQHTPSISSIRSLLRARTALCYEHAHDAKDAITAFENGCQPNAQVLFNSERTFNLYSDLLKSLGRTELPPKIAALKSSWLDDRNQLNEFNKVRTAERSGKPLCHRLLSQEFAGLKDDSSELHDLRNSSSNSKRADTN